MVRNRPLKRTVQDRAHRKDAFLRAAAQQSAGHRVVNAPGNLPTTLASAMCSDRYFGMSDADVTRRSRGLFDPQFVRWSARHPADGVDPSLEAYRLGSTTRCGWHSAIRWFLRQLPGHGGRGADGVGQEQERRASGPELPELQVTPG